MIELKLKFDSYTEANRFDDILVFKTQRLNDDEHSVLTDVSRQIMEQLYEATKDGTEDGQG